MRRHVRFEAVFSFFSLIIYILSNSLIVSSVGFRKRTAFSDALIVLRGIAAYNVTLFHLDPEVLFHIVNSGENRKEGIALAAARAADLPYFAERPGRHHVGQRERLTGKRIRTGDNGYEHPGTDSRPAGSPESAGPR